MATFLQPVRRFLPLTADAGRFLPPLLSKPGSLIPSQTSPPTELCLVPSPNQIVQTRALMMPWDEDDKRVYPGYSKAERRGRELTEAERAELIWERLKSAWKNIPGRLAQRWQEKKVDLAGNRILDCMWDYPDGAYIKEFDFRGNPSTLDRFNIVTDRHWDEGYSKAELVLSKNNMGLFRGNICTDVPIDGYVKRAGYANIKSKRQLNAFNRGVRYPWGRMTHFIARVRGDGRTYVILLYVDGNLDMTWYDTYHFFLFTRGGPYWQDVKIPFSRFFFTKKGAIGQPKHQKRIDSYQISSVGLSIMDTFNGPFQLEIDYMGVMYDEAHNPEFEYEQYKREARWIE